MMQVRRRQIRITIANLLKQGKITKAPVPVDLLARQLGLNVQHEPFEDGEISGCLVRRGKNAYVGVNSLHHENRQRFTIAHEIAHFLLHKGDRVILDRSFKVKRSVRVNLRDSKEENIDDPEEREANYFAAALLMPEDFLVKDLKNKKIDIEEDDLIKKLANHYKVSAQAMTYRLVNLGFLS